MYIACILLSVFDHILLFCSRHCFSLPRFEGDFSLVSFVLVPFFCKLAPVPLSVRKLKLKFDIYLTAFPLSFSEGRLPGFCERHRRKSTGLDHEDAIQRHVSVRWGAYVFMPAEQDGWWAIKLHRWFGYRQRKYQLGNLRSRCTTP